MKEKDIILILGGGGMMGVFTAGVLKVINEKYRNRIHSIYGTSTGAAISAYFVSNQMEIPLLFFTKYLTKKEFIRKNIISYVCKILFFRNTTLFNIKDFININYVVDVAKNSECKIDIDNFKKSKIPLYVKVINVHTLKTEYLSTEKDLFDKLKASSQSGPFSSSGVTINNSYYIDGGTIPSRIDIELIRAHKNKKIIYIEPSYSTKISKIILYPFHVLAGYSIMKLYSKDLGKKYINELFVDHREEIKKMIM